MFLFSRLVKVGTAMGAFTGTFQKIPQMVQHVGLALQNFSAGQASEEHSSHFTHLNDLEIASCQ